MIHYIPNDPGAIDSLPMREQEPYRVNREGLADFAMVGSFEEKPFVLGDQAFVWWQCREAAYAALSAFESIYGPLQTWMGRQRVLEIQPIRRDIPEFNGRYERSTRERPAWIWFRTYDYQVSGMSYSYYAAASTDMVAHEVGHAILDAIKHSIQSTIFPETTAFAEAFADCLALLTALLDGPTRDRLLATGPAGAAPLPATPLEATNFAETLMEDVGVNILRYGNPAYPESPTRHAWNEFSYRDPEELEDCGPLTELNKEAHNFSRVFTGCFYRLICYLFRDGSARSSDGLMKAAHTAGRLLFTAVDSVVPHPRLFETIGSRMLKADEKLYGGDNASTLHEAFSKHKIVLKQESVEVIEGTQHALARAHLPRKARAVLRHKAHAGPHDPLDLEFTRFAGQRILNATIRRDIPIGDLHKRLDGAIVRAPQSITIGELPGGFAAILGEPVPSPETIGREVKACVQTLLANDQIELGEPGWDRNHRRPYGLRSSGRKKVLIRKRCL
jgi:hypothetical protein